MNWNVFGAFRSDVAGSRAAIKDVGLSLIPQAAKSGAGFVTAVLLARGLGPIGMGQYALVTSLTDMIGSLSDLGIGQIALRYASAAAAHNDRSGMARVLRWAFRMRMFLVLTLSLVLLLIAPYLAEVVWKSPGLTPSIFIAVIIPIFMAVAAAPVVFFQAQRRFGMNAVIHIGQALLLVAGVGTLAIMELWSVQIAVTVIGAATAAGAIVFLAAVPREMLWNTGPADGPQARGSWWRPDFRKHEGQEELDATSSEHFALYMVLATIIVMITLKLDVWMMGVYLDQAQIGVYAIAARLTVPLVIMLGAVNTALWPRTSSATSREQIRLLARKTFRAGLLLSGVGVVYAFTIPFCATFIFGPQYAPSVHLAVILCLGHSLTFLANPLAVVGYALGLARSYWITNIVQLICVIILLMLFLPEYGATGAALTFVASTLLGGAVNGFLVWQRVRNISQA